MNEEELNEELGIQSSTLKINPNHVVMAVWDNKHKVVSRILWAIYVITIVVLGILKMITPALIVLLVGFVVCYIISFCVAKFCKKKIENSMIYCPNCDSLDITGVNSFKDDASFTCERCGHKWTKR